MLASVILHVSSHRAAGEHADPVIIYVTMAVIGLETGRVVRGCDVTDAHAPTGGLK